MQDIGFDIITDLNLSPEDSFNWEGKATSLYCLVSGNVSTDIRTVLQTLAHLSKFYHGVFFVPGTLEYLTSPDIEQRTDELSAIISQIPKVVMLHHNVVIIDGIAVMGANGWNDAVMLDSINTNEIKYKDTTFLILVDNVKDNANNIRGVVIDQSIYRVFVISDQLIGLFSFSYTANLSKKIE